jgi:hypothetical protein
MMSLRTLTHDEIDQVCGAGPTAQVTTWRDANTGDITMISATCGTGYNITANFAIGTPSFQSTVSNADNYSCTPTYSNNYDSIDFTPGAFSGTFDFSGFQNFNFS